MSHSPKLFLPLLIVPAGVLFPTWLNLIWLQSGNRATQFLNQVITLETWAGEGSTGLTTWFQDFLQKLKARDKEKKFLKSSFRILFSCSHKGEGKILCSNAKDDNHNKIALFSCVVILYFLDALTSWLHEKSVSFVLDWQLLDTKAAALSVKLNTILWQNEQWCLS